MARKRRKLEHTSLVVALPDDVVRIILRLCARFGNSWKFRSVCKRWNQMVLQLFREIKHANFGFLGNLGDAHFEHYLQMLDGERVVSVSLGGISSTSLAVMVPRISQHCPNVEEVSFPFCRLEMSWIPQVIGLFPRMKVLR